jgi:hypothetical protein
MKTKRLWKTMLYRDGELRSEHGNEGWKLGEWHKVDGPLEMCQRGYHASKNIIDAMQYVNPEAVTQVEVRGDHLEQSDKQVWSEMRVVKAWEWTKVDSVSLAVYAAESVIGIFEKKHPDDKRPRQAIEAAKAWLKDPSEENRNAAGAAWAAAWAAWDAARAAGAAGAAWAAAWAAWDAARAAARAAGAAAGDAAGDAAWAAAGAAMKQRIHRWIVRRTKSMNVIGRAK